MKTTIVGFSAALLLAVLSGCTGTNPNFGSTYDPWKASSNVAMVTITNELKADLLRPSTNLFTLGPGDQLEIEIVGNPDSRTTVALGPDGRIYFNLLPGLDVWGLTVAGTKSLLEEKLTQFETTSPKVMVTLRGIESRQVWLLGSLQKPGIYSLAGPTTLLEAIALAGGTSRSASQFSSEELADSRHSFVVRSGEFLPVDFYRLLHEGDRSQNIFLEPNDFVYLPTALSQEVYVLGAVRFPRAVRYVEEMTLVSAMAAAAGSQTYEWLEPYQIGPFGKDAYLSHVAILRGSLAEPRIVTVDYGAVIKGRAPDVRLEPGDIIYVPNSPYTTLKRYVNLIVNTFVSTVAANEGIQAAGGDTGVGISVGVGE